jgi:protein-tyrosine-phosphatase
MVCLGNICRSPMAEFMLRDAAANAGVNIEVESAGVSAEVGRSATREARVVLAEIGVSGEGHVARMLTEQMLADADLVLVATESLMRRVMQFIGADAAKTKLMLVDADLPDPWGLSLEDYRDTARQLEHMVNRVIAEATNR